jgi:hypothetical protein
MPFCFAVVTRAVADSQVLLQDRAGLHVLHYAGPAQDLGCLRERTLAFKTRQLRRVLTRWQPHCFCVRRQDHLHLERNDWRVGGHARGTFRSCEFNRILT